MSSVTGAQDAQQREAVSEALRREVEDFIFHEADLADNHEFDAWFALWTQDALYWVPANEGDINPRWHVSIVYEDLEKIETRMFRLKGRRAHAQQPRSRLARVVSNIRVEHGSAPKELIATANFTLGEVRQNCQNVWIGRLRYVLRRQDDDLKMAQKKIFLLSNDMPIGSLAFII